LGFHPELAVAVVVAVVVAVDVAVASVAEASAFDAKRGAKDAVLVARDSGSVAEKASQKLGNRSPTQQQQQHESSSRCESNLVCIVAIILAISILSLSKEGYCFSRSTVRIQNSFRDIGSVNSNEYGVWYGMVWYGIAEVYSRARLQGMLATVWGTRYADRRSSHIPVGGMEDGISCSFFSSVKSYCIEYEVRSNYLSYFVLSIEFTGSYQSTWV